MKSILGLTLVVLFAACGGKPGQTVCDNVVPAPPACQTACDPTPGAPNTCPGGFHCDPDGKCDAVCTLSGGECGDGFRCSPEGSCIPEDQCFGLECQIDDCFSQGKPPTTISGKVFAPNGTLPLFGVTVYVPNANTGPFIEGAQCSRCTDEIPGAPLGTVFTDEAGDFKVEGVPSGDNIPLIITIGKWRRQITIPRVEACTDTAVPAGDTRLPKNRTEGDIPAIAISTGDADALECLIRKIGVEDSEIGTAGEPQRIHLYTDSGAGGGEGANRFTDGFPGGPRNFANSKDFWSSVNTLRPYDITILSCEGAQHAETKSQTDMDAVKQYADLGGRLFMSHWHNVWIEGATRPAGPQRPTDWTTIAAWDDRDDMAATFNGNDTIDQQDNPKGASFATWMLNVGGSPDGRGLIPIVAGKTTVVSLENPDAEQWVFRNDGTIDRPQNFQFTTPVIVPLDQRCGKVVFSDMHVSSSSNSSNENPFPSECNTGDLTPQEKALAFMFFEISSCVGQIL